MAHSNRVSVKPPDGAHADWCCRRNRAFEIIDDTFKSPEELEEQLGLAVLGVIPFADGDVL
jgi:hypothetical protein